VLHARDMHMSYSYSSFFYSCLHIYIKDWLPKQLKCRSVLFQALKRRELLIIISDWGSCLLCQMMPTALFVVQHVTCSGVGHSTLRHCKADEQKVIIDLFIHNNYISYKIISIILISLSQ